MPFRIVVDHHFHSGPPPEQPEVLARLEQLTNAVAGLTALVTSQGAQLMEKIDQLTENLQDMSGLVDQLLQVISTGDAEKQALRQQVADLIAAAGIAEADKAALAEKIEAAFAKSEETENKMRAAIPGAPPVGGSGLGTSYADRAAFDAAVAAYTGPEAVTVDGTEVKAGSTPSIDFYSHSADGSVSTSGPTD